MLREKPLWKDSQLKTQWQRLSRSRKIFWKAENEGLPTWEPKNTYQEMFNNIGVSLSDFASSNNDEDIQMRMMQIQCWASWTKMINSAGWWAQSPKWYSSAWTGFGRSRWSFTNWHNWDGGTEPTTAVKEIRSMAQPNWGFWQSLHCTRMIL